MPQSPLAPHAVSPAELQQRLEVERRGVPFLAFLDHEGRQRLVELSPDRRRLSVGRRSENDVVLDWDSEVSRLHAELERVGGEWTLIDDGLSRNGSFVNGLRVTGRQRLRDGDELLFGETLVAFRAPSATMQSPPTRCSTACCRAATSRPSAAGAGRAGGSPAPCRARTPSARGSGRRRWGWRSSCRLLSL